MFLNEAFIFNFLKKESERIFVSDFARPVLIIPVLLLNHEVQILWNIEMMNWQFDRSIVNSFPHSICN
jgi:hypothetical protein